MWALRVVGLYITGALAGESFASSRNQLPPRGAVFAGSGPPKSEHQEYGKLENMVNTGTTTF